MVLFGWAGLYVAPGDRTMEGSNPLRMVAAGVCGCIVGHRTGGDDPRARRGGSCYRWYHCPNHSYHGAFPGTFPGRRTHRTAVALGRWLDDPRSVARGTCERQDISREVSISPEKSVTNVT